MGVPFPEKWRYVTLEWPLDLCVVSGVVAMPLCVVYDNTLVRTES